MLTITVPAIEMWDEEREMFVSLHRDQKLVLEHSLISLSKWEKRWHKPFLSKDPKTTEETIDYIRCMTVNKNCSDSVYDFLTEDNFKEIDDYINDPMTASWFDETASDANGSSEQIVTNEIIYYWMLKLNIPYTCEKWHLNQLITLIRVTSEKDQPAKKRSPQEVAMNNRALNEARLREWGTRG